MSLIAMEDVRRRYGAARAVDGATLHVAEGRVTCLLGPSGCGKSTLLRLIAGLEPVDGGRIGALGRTLSGDGVHVPPEDRSIGFVFQDYALFPHLSVADNVGFGIRHLGRDARRRTVAEQLERVRLGHRLSAYPHQLSGGEQQRVAIARALAREPALILLDEPFSGLDSPLKGKVRDDLLGAIRSAGATALIVTHDAEEALMMADDLALMDRGRILQTGRARDVYFNPATIGAAQLVGDVVTLDAVAQNGTAVSAFGAIPAGTVSGRATIAARPDGFRLDETGVEARVTEIRFSGTAVIVTIDAGGTSANARLPPLARIEAGATVRVSLDPAFCTVFSR